MIKKRVCQPKWVIYPKYSGGLLELYFYDIAKKIAKFQIPITKLSYEAKSFQNKKSANYDKFNILKMKNLLPYFQKLNVYSRKT